MIYALHGVLGLASDWDFLKSRMHEHDFEAEDLWKSFSGTDLKTWAEQKSQALIHQTSQGSGPRILLGYSLGGRLAMHLLLAQPKLWDAAIFISANPGLL